MGDMIVVAFPTIMDGLTLRWYRDVTGAERGEERTSASRNGVRLNCYLHEISDVDLAAARLAYDRLRHGRESGREEVLRMVTHQRGLLSDAVTLVTREQAS